jgi:adenine-specific DNA-methyltransferase
MSRSGNGNGNGKSPTKLGSIRHKNKRANILTEELRDFMAEEEDTPKAISHPRDQSLDPQLVWKGKNEQDREDLAVPVVPIYIQEKIHSQAIINALPRIEQLDEDQPNLFADFNGGPVDFNQKVDFYHHEQNWSNRLILGDSLLVMTSLAEKEGLKGKVQSIYLDPPYGIKFGSNWQVSTRKRDVKDGKAEDATRQPEQVRAFRDTWKLGIHSYLAYLRDRLVVARDLLTETGSIFVQIGDENVHLVRCVMDEVFGSENFCSLISVTKTSSATTELLAGVADYLLWYGKKKESIKYRDLFQVKELSQAASYNRVELADGTCRTLTPQEIKEIVKLPHGSKPYTLGDLTSQRPPGSFPVLFRGKTYVPRTNFWKTGELGFEKLINARRIEPVGSVLRYIRYFSDFPATAKNNVWIDFGGATDKIYVVQTNAQIIERCLLMTTDPGDLVLDPTCGSGSTAYVAEAVGKTLDNLRHQPRRAGARSNPHDGGEVSLLSAGGLS